MKKLYFIFLAAVCFSVAADEIFTSAFNEKQNASQWTNLGEYAKEKRVSYLPSGMIVDALSKKNGGDHFCSFKAKESLSLPEDYTLEFNSELIDAKGDAHYGVDMNGVKVVIRKGLWAFGKNLVKINQITPFVSGGDQKLIVYKMINTKSKIMVFVDGAYILEILKKEPGKSEFNFYLYNTKVKFSSVRIDNDKVKTSPNLVRNSGFETIGGTLPEYWGSFYWGIVDPDWICRMDEFRKHWGSDSATAFEGKKSFRISLPDEMLRKFKNTGKMNKATFSLLSTYLYLQKGKTYTVSAYMKTDADSLSVSFKVRSDAKDNRVNVSREWKRYFFTFQQTDDSNQICILPLGTGNLWIDAVQAEEGCVVTPYQKFLGELCEKKNDKLKSALIPMTSRAPVFDGQLDDPVWKNAYRTVLENRIDNCPVTQKTNVMLCFDDHNLYIAAECFDSRMDRVRANVKKYKGPVWDDDAIEIFLKPSPVSNMYYQFAVNTIGTKYEGLTYADSVWRADWKTAVKKYQDKWILEAAIPFSNITMPENGVLGFNIGRDNPGISEHSTWSALNSFMDFRNFGVITLDKPKTIASIRTKQVAFSRASNRADASSLEVQIENSGTETPCSVVLESPAKKQLDIILKKGLNKIVFPDLPITSGMCSVTLSGANDGKTLFSVKEEIEVQKLLSVLREFSYFSNEKEIKFKVFFNGTANSGSRLEYSLLQNGKQCSAGKISRIGTVNQIILKNNLKPGNYTLKVNFSNSQGRVLAESSDSFKLLAPKKYESKVNYWKRTLVNQNKDFFMWGISLEMRELDEVFVKYLVSYGFNVLEFSGWYPKGTPFPAESVRKTYDLCHKYGVKAVNSYGASGSKIDGIIAFDKQIGEHPASLLTYTFDEMSFNGFDKKNFDFVDREHRRLHSAVGDNIAVFQNDYDLGIMRNFNFGNADIVSLDHYPVPLRDIASTSQVLKKMKKIAGHRPISLFSQAMGNAYFTPRLPDVPEIYNQYYQGLAVDCWNFIAFANVPIENYFFPTMKKIRAERDVLLSMGVNTGRDAAVVASAPEILYLAREVKDGVVIVAVNLVRSRVENVFSGLPAQDVEVLFEKRSIQGKNGTFSDSFAPLERHVYKIKGSAPKGTGL